MYWLSRMMMAAPTEGPQKLWMPPRMVMISTSADFGQ